MCVQTAVVSVCNQPPSDALQPVAMTSHLDARASNLRAMASNLLFLFYSRTSPRQPCGVRHSVQHALSRVCYHLCVLTYMLPCACSGMYAFMCLLTRPRALICVFSGVCSRMCALEYATSVLMCVCVSFSSCGLLCVVSGACSHMCALMCVLPYVCTHVCGLICFC